MLEILKYIFSNVWYFIGTVVLIYGVGEVLVSIINSIGNIIVRCHEVRRTEIYKEK